MDKIETLERKVKNLENIVLQQGIQRENIIEALQTINTFMKNQVNANEAMSKALQEIFTQVNELTTAITLKDNKNKKEKRSMYETRNH